MKKEPKYCFKKNISQSNIHTSHIYVSIRTVAKMVVHAPIIPQNTKKVKNLKFDCVTLSPFSHAPSHNIIFLMSDNMLSLQSCVLHYAPMIPAARQLARIIAKSYITILILVSWSLFTPKFA